MAGKTTSASRAGCCADARSLYEVELIIIENQLAELRSKGNLKMLARRLTLEWLDSYQRMTNSQRRCLEALGLNRAARDVTPTLSTYIREIESQKAKAQAEDVEADA